MTEFGRNPDEKQYKTAQPGTDTGTDSKEEEIHFLKNPLPEPVRRTHIRMEFDLTDEGQEDDFDVDVSENDDFDI